MTTTRPLPPDLELSSGRIVTHHSMENGAIEARIHGQSYEALPDEMTDAEWIEYCAWAVQRKEPTP